MVRLGWVRLSQVRFGFCWVVFGSCSLVCKVSYLGQVKVG